MDNLNYVNKELWKAVLYQALFDSLWTRDNKSWWRDPESIHWIEKEGEDLCLWLDEPYKFIKALIELPLEKQLKLKKKIKSFFKSRGRFGHKIADLYGLVTLEKLEVENLNLGGLGFRWVKSVRNKNRIIKQQQRLKKKRTLLEGKAKWLPKTPKGVERKEWIK